MPSGSAHQFRNVPLFPLPNVVLFPRAVLPLHIFEQRYRDMTRDVLCGDKQIAMALLKPGWEKNYHARAEIDPVVCIGTILSHEKLADGRYNFLLQGHTRARVARELPSTTLYRIAELEPLCESMVMEIDLADARVQMVELFAHSALGETGAGRQFARLLQSPMPTREVADLAAFTFVEDVRIKQSLLSEMDVVKRVRQIVHLLQSQGPMTITQAHRDRARFN